MLALVDMIRVQRKLIKRHGMNRSRRNGTRSTENGFGTIETSPDDRVSHTCDRIDKRNRAVMLSCSGEEDTAECAPGIIKKKNDNITTLSDTTSRLNYVKNTHGGGKKIKCKN